VSFDPSLVDRVRGRVLRAGVDPTTSAVALALRQEGKVLGAVEVRQVVDEVRSDLRGFGPLDAWIAAPGVTDILINGPSDIWVDRGNGLERLDLRFRDEAAVRRLVQRHANATGRRIDDAQPYVDVQLPHRVRLHAVLPPVCDRLCVSLRIGQQTAFDLDELVTVGTVTPELAGLLTQLINHRLAFLVCGGTGSGKTTVLAALLGMVDHRARVVIVEDTAELAPDHPHVVTLEARRPNVEGQGAISMRELVRQALRMRPDRLVVGEARGEEIIDLLAALNTGHEGGCGTIHANGATEVPARVEALATAGGLDRTAAHSQLAAAVDAVVELRRRPDGSRYVSCLAVLDRDAAGWVKAEPAWQVDAAGGLRSGSGLERWQQLVGRPC